MRRIIYSLIVFGLLVSQAFAANSFTSVPFVIDTPSSGDVSITTGRINIKSMIITAYTSAKTVTFLNNSANIVLILECPAGESIEVKDLIFPNGLILDDSATDLINSSDYIFIWEQ